MPTFDLISRKQLLAKSKIIVVGIFIIRIDNSPDFVSHLAISLPLILLFFITIFVAKCFDGE